MLLQRSMTSQIGACEQCQSDKKNRYGNVTKWYNSSICYVTSRAYCDFNSLRHEPIIIPICYVISKVWLPFVTSWAYYNSHLCYVIILRFQFSTSCFSHFQFVTLLTIDGIRNLTFTFVLFKLAIIFFVVTRNN